MKILSIALSCLSLGFSLPPTLHADGVAKSQKPGIYDEAADGDKQVADAVVIAKREHKRILLQFGANWCDWCWKLHKVFETEKSVSEELKAGYVVALIDVNRGHNKHLMVKYGAETGYGLPFLVVLDSDGNHLITKHSDDFEEGDHHDPQKVLAFLKSPLMTNAPVRHSPIENARPARDEAISHQIATALLEMHRQWAANDYRAEGMTVPKRLSEQGQVSSSSAGILGAYVQYDFQKDGIEWTRMFHILRSSTNTTEWVLYESGAPKDPKLAQMAWKQELITVKGEP